MTLRLTPLPAILLLICGAGASEAQTPIAPASRPADSLFDPARHLHTDVVRPGMKGYGLSVFRGTKIERFDVEVISVLRNQVGPDHNIVLIRCGGQGLEHSGAIEGMSGSPIYLYDEHGQARMIGAFALGWENSKDPIAGVRPIEEMLRVPTTRSLPATQPSQTATRRWNALPLVRQTVNPVELAGQSKPDAGLKRLGLPISMAGVSSRAYSSLAPMFAGHGFTPLQAGAVAGTEADPKAKLEPGAAIGLPIVTGDIDVSALGTVTEMIGERVFAFGHEFNSEGAVDLPMGVGFVHTIIPSSTISFKIGSLLRLDGAIHNDESVAIAGELGRAPAMIPVTVRVKTPQRSQARTFHFQVTRHPKFTPMGVVTSISSAMMADSSLPSDFTVTYSMKLSFENAQEVNLSDVATSATQAKTLARDLNLPLTLALQNPFGRAYPTKIDATLEVQPEVSQDELTAVVSDKLIYRPGDAAELYVTVLPHGGGQATKHVSLNLPEELPEGDYTLTVGDADTILADETRDSPYRYEVRDLSEVFGLIREVTGRPSKQLYLRLAAHGQGVSVGRTPLQGLPASRVRVLARPGRADVMPYVPSMITALPWSAPLSGSTDIEIKVSRTPDKVQRPTQLPTAMPPAPPKPPPAPAPTPERDEG
jgi:hypothetical protein